MTLPDLTQIEEAARSVHRHFQATPQYSWPLLNEHLAAEVWVKHENHTPLGAFKVRGGIVYFERLVKREPDCKGVIAATRGNHGQSIALAARRYGLTAKVIVPHGNSREKNAAMRALGADVIEHGDDHQASLEYARLLADEEALHFVPSFHLDLIVGVASYSLELFQAVADIDTLYVPLGLGSGICGAIAVREALGLRTEIVGVVAKAAPAYVRSFNAEQAVSAPTEETIADGLACRTADPYAFDIMRPAVARLVEVSEEEIHKAMRLMFSATHSVCEGAGAAPLAAIVQERERNKGRRVAMVLSGSNIDTDRFASVLSG